MSTYDDASLVFYPSGYKTSVLFSEKPMDANGQLTFSRASNATRVAPNGLIEEVRTNVVTYSQDFNDASWTKTALTISTSSTANPVNGALTAQDAIPTAVLSSHRVFKLSGVASSLNTWSIYAKAKGYNFITIVENGNTSANVSFNLSTGTIGQQNSATGRIESLGNGWYRCSMIHTTSTTPRFDIYVSPTDSIASYTGDGTSGVTLFGAQAETGDIATQYIATTTSARSTFAGITVDGTSVPNVPRIDYTGGGCGKLLLEPQRSNLALWSENFDNAAWNKTASTTITANANVSPSGYQDADTYTTTASGTGSQIYRVISVSGTTQTLSIFIKYLSGSGTNLRFSIGSVESLGVNLTFSNSGATLTGVKGSSVNTLNIENYGNNWFRVSISVAYASATAEFNLFRPTGTGTDAYAIWGAQLEASTAYATSYIPTLGTSVTRVADSCSKTGISSLIGQTEGTLFLDANISNLSEARRGIVLYTDLNNYMSLRITSTNLLQFLVVASGSTQASITIANPQGNVKMALAYKANDFAAYLNGTLVGTDTSGSVPATSEFYLGYDPSGSLQIAGGVNQALLFKTRLSNSTLARLTQL